jgi:hypothetical protein
LAARSRNARWMVPRLNGVIFVRAFSLGNCSPGFQWSHAAGLDVAVLLDPQAGREALPPRRLRVGAYHDPASGRSRQAGHPRAQEHRRGRGTSSGKTTLLNALLAEIADVGDRVVILEDTRELQCAAPDCVALRTKPGIASLADLVRSTLRLRPDRIIVGEVRGPEALDMLKAWNTGHPGGLTTVHANCAASALLRLEQLIQEAVVTVPRDLIVQAIDIVVFLGGRGSNRCVETVAEVSGLDNVGNYILKPLGIPALRPVGS